MRSIWVRLWRLTRELGLLAMTLYLVDRLMRGINANSGLFYYYFVAQPLAREARLPPSRGKALVFRTLSSPESILDGLNRPSEVILKRFAQGSQCLIATKKEALVGCIWFVRRGYGEDEVNVDYELPKNGSCVWDFDVFVAESERMGFLFAKQWDVFDAMLRPEGVHYTVSRINAFNQRSIASHRSLGARDCGRALFLKLGAVQLMFASEKPFVAIGGRPALRIGPKDESTR
jgi:hypothetical protein